MASEMVLGSFEWTISGSRQESDCGSRIGILLPRGRDSNISPALRISAGGLKGKCCFPDNTYPDIQTCVLSSVCRIPRIGAKINI
jgi:hypothetical protein